MAPVLRQASVVLKQLWRPRASVVVYTSSNTRSMSTASAAKAVLADGQDATELTPQLAALVEQGWRLDKDRTGVEKTYWLKLYTKVLVCTWRESWIHQMLRALQDLHHCVGVRSKAEKHHGTMTSVSDETLPSLGSRLGCCSAAC